METDGYGVELQSSERSEQAGGGDPGGARAVSCSSCPWAAPLGGPILRTHEGIAAAPPAPVPFPE